MIFLFVEKKEVLICIFQKKVLGKNENVIDYYFFLQILEIRGYVFTKNLVSTNKEISIVIYYDRQIT